MTKKLIDATAEKNDADDRPKPREAYRGYATFRKVDDGFIATVQRPFQPRALLLYGCNAKTLVRAVLIGADLQGDISLSGAAPGKFFETESSYERLMQRYEENDILPPSWLDFRPAYPGMSIRVQIEGECDNCVMLGMVMT